jgi:hypothetical protein
MANITFNTQEDYDAVLDDLDGRWCNYRDDGDDNSPAAHAIDRAWRALDNACTSFPCTVVLSLDADAAEELAITFENCADWNDDFSSTAQ